MNTEKENLKDLFNIRFIEVDGNLKILIFNLSEKYILEGDFDFESIKTQTNGFIDSPDKFNKVWKDNDMNFNYEINEPNNTVRIFSNKENTVFSITININTRQMTYTEQSLTLTIINFKNIITHVSG